MKRVGTIVYEISEQEFYKLENAIEAIHDHFIQGYSYSEEDAHDGVEFIRKLVRNAK